MDAILIQYLVGLYFIGAGLPGLILRPFVNNRAVIAQFIFGVILVVLAYLNITLLR